MTNLFHGQPMSSIENQHIHIDFLSESGPRLVQLFVAGYEENLFADVADVSQKTPYGEYHFYGGHRLWHAPEVLPRTYIPDDGGLSVHTIPNGVQLVQPIEEATGIHKSITVQLDPQRPSVVVTHTLKNHGQWPVELAPWAITMLRLGGTGIFPQEAPVTSVYFANRQITLWNYSLWDDPRLHFHNDYILMDGIARDPALKIGYLNHVGWAGYLLGSVFFRKKIAPPANQPYPDMNCNVEAYCRDRFLELETLGPVTTLAPQESLNHVETWDIFTNVKIKPRPEEIKEFITQLPW